MNLLESNFIHSIIISLLLVNGFYNISYKLRNLTNSIFAFDDIFLSTTINYFLIINILSVFTFNILLFFELNNNFLKVISLVIICFGFYRPIYLLSFKNIFKKKKDIKLKIIYLILFFYFILSLNPITDPDSLDYHFTIPFYQIEFGNSQFYKYWLHSQLSGSGESLFLYGIILGGFHFSQIIQFSSLFFIILIVLKFSHKNFSINEQKRLFVSLSILCMPALLFLVSTSKPQLFPIATNFLSLIISFFYLKNLKNKNLIYGYLILIFLLFSSTQMKFSFLLSSGLITIFSIFQILNNKFFFKSVIIIILLFIIVILPREIFEYINLNQNLVYNFLNPVTDLFGSEAMNSSLRHGSGNSRYLIFWLFIPYDQLGNFHIGQVTYCLGPFALYFLFNYNFKLSFVKKSSIIFIVYFIAALFLAQPVGRFYIEIFIWMLFFSILYFKSNLGIFQKIINKSLIVFSLIYLIILGYFSLNLFKGNFSKKLYDNVLSENADGYLLYKWANQVIPDESVIISTHRSSAFYKYEVVSYEFRLFGGYTKEGFSYYLNEIMKKNPKYILYKSTEINDKRDIFKKCRGELYKYKKNVGYVAGRNPFRTYKNYYDGYIYKLSNNKIKDCLK